MFYFVYLYVKITALIIMPFEKGNKLATGRPIGAVNTLTKTIRERVLEVFNELQNDPKANLLEWGKENPWAFYQIASKLIPTEINHSLDNKVITVVTKKKPSEIEDAEVIP